ncbi:SGNH/GDSL hydrolase family protein [Algoriphagus zhangzhouensis]|uniref:Lysophospholipase L1 n=1 Tax=Algoriphagus zhangzhouensis TaxID=1073327 RepID=A0A1M7ZAL0_9BACT|nr:SGNH/GDSL hydrolase family protein [Algoriphagus zhangzhouensis]TDY47083.1 lysophospholipase L1-like esterase [Algoriphagus zhangzhouensis]SHO61958.1 Lysophospholipase L1 [Algoriphagus zhangzhouensis]
MKVFLSLLLSFFLISNFHEENPKWVAIGDSITYLNDHQDETGNRVTKGYLTLIGEEFPELDIVNKGYNGWTAVAIAEKFKDLEIPKADFYSIFLGTNDWWGSKPLGTFKDFQNATGNSTVNGAFRTILDNIKSLNPDAKIILITPMKRVDFVYINNYKNNAFGSYKTKNDQDLEDFAKAIKKIGKKEGIPVIDLYHHKQMDFPDLINFKRLKNPETGNYQNYPFPEFIDIPFDPENDQYPYPEESINITFDGLHPSDKGYQLIFEGLSPLFKGWLER